MHVLCSCDTNEVVGFFSNAVGRLSQRRAIAVQLHTVLSSWHPFSQRVGQ